VIIAVFIIYTIASANTSNTHKNISNPPKREVKSRTYSKEFSVGDRAVNQADLGEYLQTRVGGIINIRYQSPRAGSSKYWRNIKLVKYDGTYLYIDDNKSHNRPVRYRLDRVIEYK
jgi:hypothetical protein